MVEVEKIAQELERKEVLNITSQGLKELGLNAYYINKLVETNYLERVSRGNYRVIKTYKYKQQVEYFNKFCKCVFNNDFDEAYKNLKLNKEIRINHNYDNHLRCYLILLKQLVSNPQEFEEFEDEILEFTERSDSIESYYQYFIKFREAIMSFDFPKALENITQFGLFQQKIRGRQTISTKVFMHLTKAVCSKNKQISSTGQNYQMEKETYQSFLNFYEQGNYEEALQCLKKCLSYKNYKNMDNQRKLIDLISTYISIHKTKEPLPITSYSYDHFGNQYSLIFNEALHNKDYITAYRNIGKCIYQNPTSQFLQLYRSILKKIYDENKKNTENKQSTPQLSHTLTIEDIYELLCKKEYSKVMEFLNQTDKTENRYYFYMLKMLTDRNLLITHKGNIYKEKVSPKIESDDPFKKFFEFLKYSDYEEANSIVENCLQYTKEKNSNILEFSIY